MQQLAELTHHQMPDLTESFEKEYILISICPAQIKNPGEIQSLI